MDEQRARELLARERSRVQRELAELGVAVGDPESDPLENAEQASDLLEREIEAGLAEGLRDELAAIGRAEERLAGGTYGRSVESGRPIPDARLEAIPWAERSAEEQARFERSHA